MILRGDSAMGKNNFIVSLIAGLTISLTLFLTIIIKSGTPFEWNLLLVYIGVGIVGFGYGILLGKLKMLLAAKLFLVFTIMSGIYFYISMPKGPEALSQLGAFMGWLLLMVLSILLPIIIELIARLKKKGN